MELDEQMPHLDALVERIFHIEDKALAPLGKESSLLMRYHGRLRGSDSSAAYDQLAADLRPMKITPLFRLEDGRQTILLVSGVVQARPGRGWVNLLFFFLTLLSVLYTGGVISLEGTLPSGFWPAVSALISAGWPFAVSMLGILAAHEFGHYLAGRAHGTHVSLPYFLPLPAPISPFGTMGAFINMKEPPKNRNVLLDIGIAGPLAGLIVAIPVLLIGLSLSELQPLPATPGNGLPAQLEGNSLLYLLAKFVVFGRLLPEPQVIGPDGSLLYWVRYLMTGQPLPYGGLDVILHPVAWAGWAGLLITALNLIPAGQLDGGHMVNVLLGPEKARRLIPVILVALAALGIIWSGWWLWVLIIFMLGRAYAEPLDTITPLDDRRKGLAVLALVIFVLVFTPVPLNLML